MDPLPTRRALLRPSPRSSQQGSSLFILLMAGVVLLALFGMAGLTVEATSSYGLEATGDRVGNLLARAADLARQENRAVGVRFDVGGTEYFLVDDQGRRISDRADVSRFVVDVAAPGTEVLIDAAMFGRGGSTVMFDPPGVLRQTGSITIRQGDAVSVLWLDADGTLHQQ